MWSTSIFRSTDIISVAVCPLKIEQGIDALISMKYQYPQVPDSHISFMAGGKHMSIYSVPFDLRCPNWHEMKYIIIIKVLSILTKIFPRWHNYLVYTYQWPEVSWLAFLHPCRQYKRANVCNNLSYDSEWAAWIKTAPQQCVIHLWVVSTLLPLRSHHNNSPYCLSYNSYEDSLENLVLDQLIIP